MTERPHRSSWPWTRADDDKLRELALANASSRAIAQHLGRTAASIRSRAQRLNVILKKVSVKR